MGFGAVRAHSRCIAIPDFRGQIPDCRRFSVSLFHKEDVINFELNLSESLWRLHGALESKTCRPAPYYPFTIHDPKTREIQALRFADRVVQRSLFDNALRPWFEARLICDCAACRKGEGTHFAMDRLTEFMRGYYRQHGARGWILKCDVRKYFDSVDHEALKVRLRRFPDPDVRDMLFRIVDSCNADTGKVIRRLRSSNKRRFKRRLKLFQRQYAAGQTDLDAIKRSLARYRGHLMHGHTWKLSKKVFGKFVLVRPSIFVSSEMD